MNERARNLWAVGRSVSMWRSAWSMMRSFTRAKGVAAAAALTVALGIGVNGVVFSLFDRLLFRPLPYAEPSRLVQISWPTDYGLGYPVLPTKVMLELARQPNLFSGIAWAPGGDVVPMTPVSGENPLFWFTGVTTNTLDVLGVHPVIGAGFSTYPATDQDRPVLLTYDVWQHRYGGSTDVLALEWSARDARQQDVHWRVVGVLPEDFLMPAPRMMTAGFDGIYGIDPGFDRQVSLAMVGAAPFARLAPGVSFSAAQFRVNAFMATAFPRWNNPATLQWERGTARLAPLQSGLSVAARPYAWIAVVAGWVVLGATCLTLAILLLTWTQSQRQDAGVRLALGATPGRLIARALAESLWLCGAGALIGGVAYAWGQPLFVRLLPRGLQAFASAPGDARVLVLMGAIAVVTAMIAGIVPAIRRSRTSPLDVLRTSSGATSADRVVGGPVLLTVQAAFGVMLLVGASATVPAVTNALLQSPGFDATDLYAVHVPTSFDLTANDAMEQVRRAREAADLARHLPGVVAVSIAKKDPLWQSSTEKQFVGKPNTSGFAFAGRIVPVDRDLFPVLGTALVAGRTFSAGEIDAQSPVVVVNETAARGLSPGLAMRAVVGQTVATEDGPRVVIGVVEDFRVGIEQGRLPTLFLPLSAEEAYRQARGSPYHYSSYDLLLRMAPGRTPDVSMLWNLLRERPWWDREVLGTRGESVAARLNLELATPRLLALIFGTLGAITLLLAVIAIVGLTSFEIRRRREEMTVRLALGATHQALRRRLALVTVRPIVAGVLAGLPLSWMQTTLLARAVPTIHANDPRTYAGAAAAMILVALAAAWIPGWRSITLRVAEVLRAG